VGVLSRPVGHGLGRLLGPLLLFSCFASTAVAEEVCLDDNSPLGENGARKGVQRKDFLKRMRLEVSVQGGFFAADMVSTSYNYGGSIAFYPVEDFGIEANLVVTNITLGIEKPLTAFFAGNVFTPGIAYIVTGNLVWAPVHMKIRVAPRAIVHGDVFFVVGGGDTINQTAQGGTFDFGIGMKLYPNKWVALRFDLRDFIILQEAVGVQRVTNNLVGSFGISLFIPGPRPSASETQAAKKKKGAALP
jgi:outer membrane beta-barrel protein